MQHLAAQGAYTGGKAPFGYRLDGERLAEEADEQAVIREAQALRTQGLFLRAVAAKLHDLGFRTRTGRTFAAVQGRVAVCGPAVWPTCVETGPVERAGPVLGARRGPTCGVGCEPA